MISGVGHEVDVTLADLVADLRAPTPTAAAELVCPNTEKLFNQLESIAFRLPKSFERLIQRRSQQVDFAGRQLVHPKQQLERNSDKLQQLTSRLSLSMKSRISKLTTASDNLSRRLQFQNPQRILRSHNAAIQLTNERLNRAVNGKLHQVRQYTDYLGSQLHLVSPLATLDRGFAIGRDKKNRILRNTEQVNLNDKINIQLSDGNLDCEIIEVNK